MDRLVQRYKIKLTFCYISTFYLFDEGNMAKKYIKSKCNEPGIMPGSLP